jgi:hypothetical protein
MGGGHIFTGNIDVRCAGPMMVAMIAFCAVLDMIMTHVEHKVRPCLLAPPHTRAAEPSRSLVQPNRGHGGLRAMCGAQLERSRSATEMLSKVYRELMILGFIGFTFIGAKERGLVTSPSFIHCFEFCDLMVTIVVFLYTGSTFISSFFMHVSRRQWDRYAVASTETVCKKLESHFLRVDSSAFYRFRHWLSNRFDHGWRDEADFKMCELLFKQQFNMERSFDYNSYILLGAWCSLFVPLAIAVPLAQC